MKNKIRKRGKKKLYTIKKDGTIVFINQAKK